MAIDGTATGACYCLIGDWKSILRTSARNYRSSVLEWVGSGWMGGRLLVRRNKWASSSLLSLLWFDNGREDSCLTKQPGQSSGG